MERFPIVVRVALTFGLLGVDKVFLAVETFTHPLVDVDLQVSRDSAVFLEEEGELLRVHLFNFSLNRDRVFLVASAATVLNAHLHWRI